MASMKAALLAKCPLRHSVICSAQHGHRSRRKLALPVQVSVVILCAGCHCHGSHAATLQVDGAVTSTTSMHTYAIAFSDSRWHALGRAPRQATLTTGQVPGSHLFESPACAGTLWGSGAIGSWGLSHSRTGTCRVGASAPSGTCFQSLLHAEGTHAKLSCVPLARQASASQV